MNNSKKTLILLLSLFFCLELYSSPRVERFNVYNEKQGLSNGTVHDFCKDSYGYLWIATENGLNRFNGYEFKQFHHNNQNSNSLLTSNVRKIFEDSEKRLWIFGANGGLQLFDLQRNTFTNLRDSFSILNQNIDVLGFVEDAQKRIWIITGNAGIFIYNLQTKAITEFWKPYDFDLNSISAFSNNSQSKLFLVNESFQLCVIDLNTSNVIRLSNLGEHFKNETQRVNSLHTLNNFIIMGTESNGVHVLKNDQMIRHLTKGNNNNSLSSNLISDITSDHLGRIWIGTSIFGVNILDTVSWNVTKVLKSNVNNSISGDGINCFYRDNDDIIWIGGFKSGISAWLKENEWLGYYNLKLPYKGSNVRSLVEDGDDNIWIANGGDITSVSLDENEVTHYQSLTNDVFGIKNEKVRYLLIDKKNNFYFGTRQCDLIIKKNDTGNLIRWTAKDIFKNDKKNVHFTFLRESYDGKIIIGTSENGFVIYSPDDQSFKHFFNSPEADFYVDFNGVNSLTIGSDSTIWLGTNTAGLVSLKLNGNKLKYYKDIIEDNLLSVQNEITTLRYDAMGHLWIGTPEEGLFKYNIETRKVINYSFSEGGSSTNINSIIDDLDGNIWIATDKGISFLNIEINKIYNLAAIKGYDGEEFIRDASFRDANGNIYFGLIAGYFKINPDKIKVTQNIPVIQITDIKVLHDKKSLSYNELNYPESISLKYFQNYISIRFAALVFKQPKNITYQYKLEGLEEAWNYTKGERNVTYTNLAPGNYTFKVRSTNEYNIWVENEISLPINIAKPYWATPWAFLTYFVVFFMILLVIRKYILERIELRKMLYKKHLEQKKVEEIDNIKTRFFTNITHELKSPLTLIITPLQRMFQENDFILNKEKINQFSNILKNAKRLQGMIGQLLDIAKLQSGRMQLHFKSADIVLFTKGLLNEFKYQAREKNINIHYKSSTQSGICYFDQEVLEKMISNIVSNAIKYTRENGDISVSLILVYRDDDMPDRARIIFEDNGIGIEENELEMIFERFYQVKSDRENDAKSLGIGLALVKELTELHNGHIKVDSTPGVGTTIEVEISVNGAVLKDFGSLAEIKNTLSSESANSGLFEDLSIENPMHEENPLILIVEDDKELREYLKENLSKGFRIEAVGDAEQGLTKANQLVPDLIITDLMLPGANGDVLVQKLREERITSHIPIIILTARTSDVTKMSSYIKGVDDYITKPFNFLLLRARIHNLLDTRKRIKDKFEIGNLINENAKKTNVKDKRFLLELNKILEENYHNTDFNVEIIETEMNLTNLQLYRKLKALTNHSGNALIRNFRLKKSISLLLANNSNISEIAYKVGFNDPAYFTRCFTKEFGLSPSNYVINHNNIDFD